MGSNLPHRDWPRLLKPPVFAICLLPFAWMVWDTFTDGLGPNPLEAVTHHTGDWALRLLLVTLAVTPLRRLTGWTRVLRFRRMLGLFSFFYALLHFLTWLWLDQGFAWGAIVADIAQRPYITVGFAALVMLTALAITSTRGWMRRLGRNWQRLHRLIYPAAILGIIHYVWLVKADLLEPGIYGLVLAGLLAMRLVPKGTLSFAERR
jgi:sulfoxide reductase heme-binding subunit YedZ